MLLAILGSALVSTSALFLRYSPFDPAVTGCYRTLIGALLLFVPMSAAVRKRCRRRDFLLGAFAAGVCFTADFVCWSRSIDLVGPGLATLLNGLQVIFVVGLRALFLKDRPSTKQLLGLPAAVFGLVLLLNVVSGASGILGIAYGIASALFFSCYIMAVHFLRSRAHDVPAFRIIAAANFWSTLCLCLVGFARGAEFSISSSSALALVVAYGVVCQAAWCLISYSMKRISQSQAAAAMLTQPVVTYVWDLLFFGKQLSVAEVLGALLIIFAIRLIGSEKERDRRQSKEQAGETEEVVSVAA